MAQFVITTNSKVINKQLKALESMRSAFDSAAHIQALCGLLYAVEFRQTTPMNQLVELMGHSKGAMNKWAVEFGPFTWTPADKKTGAPATLRLNDAKQAQMLAELNADRDAYVAKISTHKTYLELTPPKNEFPGFDLGKVLKRELAKADRYRSEPEKYPQDKIDLAGLDKLRALVTELDLRKTATVNQLAA